MATKAKGTPENLLANLLDGIKPRILNISAIRRDGGTQPRDGTIESLVEEYARLIGDGVDLGPVDVFYDGSAYWLYDGFHRVRAHETLLIDSIACTVHMGTKEDAQWASYAANKAHGLNRTQADKERAVKAALRHPQGPERSDREIAAHVGVSHPTVAKYRAELQTTGNFSSFQTRTGADGKARDTSGISASNAKRSKPAAYQPPVSPEQRQYESTVAAVNERPEMTAKEAFRVYTTPVVPPAPAGPGRYVPANPAEPVISLDALEVVDATTEPERLAFAAARANIGLAISALTGAVANLDGYHDDLALDLRAAAGDLRRMLAELAQ